MTPQGDEPQMRERPRSRREVFRLESEWNGTPRLLVGINAGDGFLLLANEDDVSAQSVVLSPYEVRWLAEQWRPSGRIATWRFSLVNLRWRFCKEGGGNARV